jgi:hypothetical protein
MVMPNAKQVIEVKGTPILIIQVNQTDYISLTNIARYKNPSEPKDIVKNCIIPALKGSNSTPLSGKPGPKPWQTRQYPGRGLLGTAGRLDESGKQMKSLLSSPTIKKFSK